MINECDAVVAALLPRVGMPFLPIVAATMPTSSDDKSSTSADNISIDSNDDSSDDDDDDDVNNIDDVPTLTALKNHKEQPQYYIEFHCRIVISNVQPLWMRSLHGGLEFGGSVVDRSTYIYNIQQTH
jgi:hypothetical protein